MPGTRDEHGVARYVKNYREWARLENPDTRKPNEDSFNWAPFEYGSQIVYFWLGSTFFLVLERLGHLGVLVAVIAFLFNVSG